MRRNRRYLFRGLAVLTVIGLWTGSAPAGDDLAEVELKQDVVYGTGAGENLKLDLAAPREVKAPLPGIVFIHGGGWQAGNKSRYRNEIQAFAANGYIVASVGYRLAPKHRCPCQIEDVKCAVRWMRAHAGELKLDPARIGAIGDSAGAHLSMLLGTMDSSDGLEGEGGWAEFPSKVQAVVAYYGPIDLTQKDVENSPAKEDIMVDAARLILTNFVGGNPEEHTEQLRRVSPITYVSKGDAPILIFQGTKDRLVPYDQAFAMATSLTAAEIPGRVEFILGAGHGWGGDEIKRTQGTALAFFEQHLKGAK